MAVFNAQNRFNNIVSLLVLLLVFKPIHRVTDPRINENLLARGPGGASQGLCAVQQTAPNPMNGAASYDLIRIFESS